MLQSENFTLREARKSDDEFILELINQPAWKKFISDHSIETPDQAQEYIESRLMPMYQSQVLVCGSLSPSKIKSLLA